jgi:hypothetical protein
VGTSGDVVGALRLVKVRVQGVQARAIRRTGRRIRQGTAAWRPATERCCASHRDAPGGAGRGR